MNIVRETPHFCLVERRGRYRVHTKERGAIPRSRRVRKADADYLLGLSIKPYAHLGVCEFDSACVIDFAIDQDTSFLSAW